MTSLIIPTHNRPKSLKRLVFFLNEQNIGINVLIPDSSKDVNFLKNKKTIEAINSTIKINHMDCRNMSLNAKLELALENVETPLACFCGDDDFPILSEMKKCEEFLLDNKDYSLAHGRIYQFEPRPIKILPFYLSVYPQFGYVDDDPVERLSKHFHHYSTTWYAVHKTKSLLCNLKKINSMDIGFALKERVFSAFDLIEGKRKMFNEVFMFRQKGNTLVDEEGNYTLGETMPIGGEFVDEIKAGYSIYEDAIISYLSEKSSEIISSQNKQALCETVRKDHDIWTARKYKSRAINKPSAGVYSLFVKFISKNQINMKIAGNLDNVAKVHLNKLQQVF